MLGSKLERKYIWCGDFKGKSRNLIMGLTLPFLNQQNQRSLKSFYALISLVIALVFKMSTNSLIVPPLKVESNSTEYGLYLVTHF